MNKIRDNSYATVISVILVAVFLVNLVLSRNYNWVMISLTGGGRLVDLIGISRSNVFDEQQYYRILTYGYLHPAIWHLAVNVCALWYVGLFLRKH